MTLFALAVVLAVPAEASPVGPSPPSRAADGAIGLRLVDVPIGLHNDPRGRIYIVDHLAPGTIIHRRIEVSNTSDSTVRVDLYAAAATIANGSFLGSPGNTRNDLSTWTSISPLTSDVAAHSRFTAIVTVTVPSDASPGERYGVVWAEARSAPIAGVGITFVSRVGVRLYLSVGPGGPPASNFTIDSLTAERAPDDRPIVAATVDNIGGRALDMSGSLELSDGPGRLSAGPFPATLGLTLAIAATEPVTFSLDKLLPAGPWHARITLESGLVEHSAQATITFPDTGTSPPVNVARAGRALWPYLTIAGITALLFSIAALALTRPRRRAQTPRAMERGCM